MKNGNVLDRKDLFIKSRVKKDGRPVNEHCAAIIVRFILIESEWITMIFLMLIE